MAYLNTGNVPIAENSRKNKCCSIRTVSYRVNTFQNLKILRGVTKVDIQAFVAVYEKRILETLKLKLIFRKKSIP